MLFGLRPNARQHRYREIIAVLSRHGFGAVVSEAGLSRAVPFHRGLLGHARQPKPYTTAEHLRLAMEELGTTAIKAGQVLSTRPDFVGPEYIAEFEKLRDRVPPVPFEAVVEIVERELGGTIRDLFAEFEVEPVASASIGQVHGAVLHDGRSVVVKVRKPGVAARVEEDLGILGDLARRAASRGIGSFYDLEELVDDLGWTLRAELDYVREGRNADRLREILGRQRAIVVPAIQWELTTEAVLVMERLEGVPLAEAARSLSRTDLRRLAEAAARALLTEIFEAGFFHADPHPGNFLVMPGGRLGLLDFGMVGVLDDERKVELIHLLDAAIRQDGVEATEALEALGALRTAASRASVRRDLQHLLESYYGLPLSEVDVSGLLRDLMAVVRRNRLQLPTELALVLKTVGMSESLWRQLDPEFNIALVAEPFASRVRSSRWLLAAMRRRTVLAADISHTLGKLLDQLRRLDLLIVDELGYLPMDARRANLFFQLVAARYTRGSLLITTNVAFDGWGKLFGDDVIASAILDRLLHISHVFAINGPSYRLKDKLPAAPEPQPG